MLLCRAQVDPLLTLRWHTSLSGLKGAPPPRPAGHSATTHRRGASGTRGASPGQGRGAGFSSCAVAEAIRSLLKLTVRRPCGGADTPTRAPQARSAPTPRIPIQEAPPHWEVSTTRSTPDPKQHPLRASASGGYQTPFLSSCFLYFFFAAFSSCPLFDHTWRLLSFVSCFTALGRRRIAVSHLLSELPPPSRPA